MKIDFNKWQCRFCGADHSNIVELCMHWDKCEKYKRRTEERELTVLTHGRMTIDPKQDIPMFPPIDPGFCGVDPLTTGQSDPWWKRGACAAHDEAYQSLIDKAPGEPALRTFGRFTKDIVSGMAEGAYMLLSGPLYWLIGGVGGVFRQGQLERRHKAAKPWVTPGDKNDGLGE